MELETVMSYVTNSVNPDGVSAQQVKEVLDEDIQEELSHAPVLLVGQEGLAVSPARDLA